MFEDEIADLLDMRKYQTIGHEKTIDAAIALMRAAQTNDVEQERAYCLAAAKDTAPWVEAYAERIERERASARAEGYAAARREFQATITKQLARIYKLEAERDAFAGAGQLTAARLRALETRIISAGPARPAFDEGVVRDLLEACARLPQCEYCQEEVGYGIGPVETENVNLVRVRDAAKRVRESEGKP